MTAASPFARQRILLWRRSLDGNPHTKIGRNASVQDGGLDRDRYNLAETIRAGREFRRETRASRTSSRCRGFSRKAAGCGRVAHYAVGAFDQLASPSRVHGSCPTAPHAQAGDRTTGAAPTEWHASAPAADIWFGSCAGPHHSLAEQPVPEKTTCNLRSHVCVRLDRPRAICTCLESPGEANPPVLGVASHLLPKCWRSCASSTGGRLLRNGAMKSCAHTNASSLTQL
jgi:hypothetical protein